MNIASPREPSDSLRSSRHACAHASQLMAEQDLDQLGYSAASDERAVRPLGVDSEVAKVKTGFVAGLPADMKKESS